MQMQYSELEVKFHYVGFPKASKKYN